MMGEFLGLSLAKDVLIWHWDKDKKTLLKIIEEKIKLISDEMKELRDSS